MNGLHVSRAWIEWAHGPLTECADAATKYPTSCGLVARCAARPKSYRSIIVTTSAEVRELLAVAECYGRGSATDDMGPWWIGYHRRLVRLCRAVLAEASR